MNYVLTPNLIENNVKYFLNSTLENTNNFKQKYFNNIFNIVTFIGITVLITIILCIKYKGNKNTKEIQLKRDKDRQYIIQRLIKIKKDNISEKNREHNLITNLPVY